MVTGRWYGMIWGIGKDTNRKVSSHIAIEQNICRPSSVLKKGYPHGQAVLSYPNNTAAWAGQFRNGVTRGEVDQEIKQQFGFFMEHPFRTNIRLSNI